MNLMQYFYYRQILTNVLFQWITVIKIQLASTAMDCFHVIVMQDLQETERFVKVSVFETVLKFI